MDVQLGATFSQYGEQVRDALHVPVISVRSLKKLMPGQQVVFTGGTSTDGEYIPFVEPARAGTKGHGIVDPFLVGEVPPRTGFWLLRNPGGEPVKLQHVWSDDVFRPIAAQEPEDDGCRGCY
jgi:hypothetical protein